jgi:putative endonuclease
MYTIYAIKSLSRNYIYVGMTSDLEARLKRHNSGYERTTKPYCPFELIFTETVETREKA